MKASIDIHGDSSIIDEKNGAVAQLGERLVRSEKAASSTLVCSIPRWECSYRNDFS